MTKHSSILLISDHPEMASFVLDRIRQLNVDQEILSLVYTQEGPQAQALCDLGGRLVDLSCSEEISTIIRSYSLVLSIHCKNIFPSILVDQVLCINLHPGYNPFNRGWFPQAFSIINELPCGATLHRMTTQIDHGEIIAQNEISISDTDTSLDVYRNIIAAEKRLIVDNLPKILMGTFTGREPISTGTFNSKKDYAKLCQLNLQDIDTLENHLKLLRAVSHGDFQNAYITTTDGQRRYLKIHFFEDPDGKPID